MDHRPTHKTQNHGSFQNRVSRLFPVKSQMGAILGLQTIRPLMWPCPLTLHVAAATANRRGRDPGRLYFRVLKLDSRVVSAWNEMLFGFWFSPSHLKNCKVILVHKPYGMQVVGWVRPRSYCSLTSVLAGNTGQNLMSSTKVFLVGTQRALTTELKIGYTGLR